MRKLVARTIAHNDMERGSWLVNADNKRAPEILGGSTLSHSVENDWPKRVSSIYHSLTTLLIITL